MAAIDQTHKSCTRCKNTYSTDLFYKQKQMGDNGKCYHYYDSMCKECRNDYTSERATNYKKAAFDYKGGKCFDCGLVDNPSLYDFHHIDPLGKDFEIGQRKSKILNEEVKKELDKCVLLCALCHRRRHVCRRVKSSKPFSGNAKVA